MAGPLENLLSAPLSVLDLAPVTSDSTPAQALANSTDLAQHAERLGYVRYWVAEHHNMPGIASSAPAVLIAHLADATSTIRVGSGGVMLANHAPLVVAEQFAMLEALHPGRIDLGLGRAPGTDPVTARALRRSAQSLSGDDFPVQLGELIGFFTGRFPQGHDYRTVSAVPAGGDMPPIWLLGSSDYSAQVAGLLGMPFAYAHHFSPTGLLRAVELYRLQFRPSAVLERPYAMVAVNVLCAPDEEEADWLAGSNRMATLRSRMGQPGRFPSPEEAAAWPLSDQERDLVRRWTSHHIVGSQKTVAAGLSELAASSAADELMITTVAFDHRARLRSYELVAELRSPAESTGATPPAV